MLEELARAMDPPKLLRRNAHLLDAEFTTESAVAATTSATRAMIKSGRRRAPFCPCLSFVSTACLSYGIYGMVYMA